MTRSSAIPEKDLLQSTSSQSFQDTNLEPIAVVGIGLKFPQDADTIDGFWDLLTAGRATVTDVPKDRWNVDSYYHPNPDRNDTVSDSHSLMLYGFFGLQFWL